MFCGKCGNQIPDDVDFCPKCGSKINRFDDINGKNAYKDNNGEFDSKVDGQQTVFSSNKVSTTKVVNRKPLIIGGIIASIVIVAIICITNLTKYKTIDLNKYVTISADGYDGYGTAKYELDSEALSSDFISKYKLKKTDSGLRNTIMDISNGLGITDYACSEAFLLQLGNLSLSQNRGLSNGDTIVLSWENLNSNNGERTKQLLRDTFNISIEYSDIEYSVSGLKPLKKVNPFEEINFQMSGLNDTKELILSPSSSGDISFDIDESGPYSNGETVTIRAFPKEFANLEEYTIKTGVIIEPETINMEVSGLSTLVSKLDQIPEEYLNSLIENANAQIEAYVSRKISDGEWDGKDEYDGKIHFDYSKPILCKEYLITSVETVKNELILLYRVDYHVLNKVWEEEITAISSHGDAKFPLYVGVAFNNGRIMIDSSGKAISGGLTCVIMEDDDVMDDLFVNYYLLKDKDGSVDHTVFAVFDDAYTLEGFELKYIDSRAEPKDIRVIDEYEGPVNVDSISKH